MGSFFTSLLAYGFLLRCTSGKRPGACQGTPRPLRRYQRSHGDIDSQRCTCARARYRRTVFGGGVPPAPVPYKPRNTKKALRQVDARFFGISDSARNGGRRRAREHREAFQETGDSPPKAQESAIWFPWRAGQDVVDNQSLCVGVQNGCERPHGCERRPLRCPEDHRHRRRRVSTRGRDPQQAPQSGGRELKLGVQC
jgi:hypothetical protein